MLGNQVTRWEVRVDWLLLSCWKPCLSAKRFCPWMSKRCLPRKWLKIQNCNLWIWIFCFFKLWVWENGQLLGKTDVGATFVWLYFRRKEAEWKLKENKVLAFSTLQIFSCQWWKPTWTSAKVSSWVWLLVWSDAKDIFGILCKSNKTLSRPIY